ncbi:ATP-binding protein [Thermoleptolyngbya sichuanensis XZ-Cy5]|uniref:slr1658 superfamily regulator n=1 Tax=Thermoleptolyngbya sichuanensis TaxID=2885951 RepID=UPI00240DBFF9|nr:ATP-binding protein [Thermoleptolyngbya sichuanensis]MDG2617896.1 ATP-binding protein [Thermoleptolyngbya sichuanensis XZ-Cy5]
MRGVDVFPADERDPKTLSRRTEMQDAVRYIANELLENAMKFHDEASRQPITIKLQLHPNCLVFWVTNSVRSEAIAPFQRFIQDILAAQPLERYLQQLEQNALNDEHTASGIGLLTMMVDYGAIVGWKFTQLEQMPPVMTVTTRVQVPI